MRDSGGLAPWQERRAKTLMVADLARTVTLAELALACGLSRGHFSLAFRQSVGCPPHRWLLLQRLERAMHLMVASDKSLCEIAIETGFSDQSHLTRAFSQYVETSPAAWRRIQRGDPGTAHQYAVPQARLRNSDSLAAFGRSVPA
ncbi:MAG: AraC family transcriptional regulator [Rhizomicrobium sp.]